MNKLISFCIGILYSISLGAQQIRHDTIAVLILDRMSELIGNLESCSFNVHTMADSSDHKFGMIKHYSDYEVYLSGPSKMLVNAHGHKGHRVLMYNGKQLSYYSFDENNYGIISTPPTFIETVDKIYREYEIEFPAADFFYPAFTDDLIEASDSLRYAGMLTLNGKELFHLIAYTPETIIQFWIENNAFILPVKFSITYTTKPRYPQYLASFSNWKINPLLPPAMFDFLPPPGANKVRFLSKADQ